MKFLWLFELPLKARVLLAGIAAMVPFWMLRESAPFETVMVFLLVMFATSRLGQFLSGISWW